MLQDSIVNNSLVEGNCDEETLQNVMDSQPGSVQSSSLNTSYLNTACDLKGTSDEISAIQEQLQIQNEWEVHQPFPLAKSPTIRYAKDTQNPQLTRSFYSNTTLDDADSDDGVLSEEGDDSVEIEPSQPIPESSFSLPPTPFQNVQDGKEAQGLEDELNRMVGMRSSVS